MKYVRRDIWPIKQKSHMMSKIVLNQISPGGKQISSILNLYFQGRKISIVICNSIVLMSFWLKCSVLKFHSDTLSLKNYLKPLHNF